MPVWSSHTDQELLEAIRNDNEQAFHELFRRYWRKVHDMAYSRVRSKEATEEIVQDLFISLWNRRASLLIDNLSSYLYTSVKHRVLNHIESQIVRKKYWEYYKNFIPQQEDVTTQAIEFDALMEAIENGIEHLPEKSKKVFRLNRLEGLSVPEIASILNLSEKAIQYHLTKSLKKLRLHLKDYILTVCLICSLLGTP